jgi:hypothetical protein
MITLATLHEHTAQEVFDYISRHLLTQGEKCHNFDLNLSPCAYKNSDGQSCAAGCLIGEKEYDQSFEGKDWCNLLSDGKVPDVHYGLISSMQKVHDTHYADNWYSALQKTAAVYGFDTANLDMYAKENNYC